MSEPSRASVLAVGTELTTGQIINRNAAWISEKLSNLGIETVLHETVPDDRALIRAALDRCAQAGRLVFVTGGLGPTTDDFTRDVIGEWASLPMEYHEPSWKRIEARLTRLGVRVASSNRQQCFFPQGAVVLPNSAGTADGFRLRRGETELWVLPGPPPEIEAIWNGNGIDGAAAAFLPADQPRLTLKKWQCMGKSEAELGEIVEQALATSGFRTGYRVHRPYIEVKVWIPDLKTARPHLEKLEKAIAPWLICRDDEDVAHAFLETIRAAETVDILDSCSGGILAQRLGALLRKTENRELARSLTIVTEFAPADTDPLSWVTSCLEDADEESLTLVISGFTPSGGWALGLREGARTTTRFFESPYRDSGSERSRAYAAEMALQEWRDAWTH